jgi:hypothetical protein
LHQFWDLLQSLLPLREAARLFLQQLLFQRRRQLEELLAEAMRAVLAHKLHSHKPFQAHLLDFCGQIAPFLKEIRLGGAALME